MGMYCFQCQEAKDCIGCTSKGVCGKEASTASLQDTLIFVLKGVSLISEEILKDKKLPEKVGNYIVEALFTTITNVNFDDNSLMNLIQKGLKLRNELMTSYDLPLLSKNSIYLTWNSQDLNECILQGQKIGLLSNNNEDIRSLRELLTYGIKGMAAYYDHAKVLGYTDSKIIHFMIEGLAATTKDLTIDQMLALVLKTGEYSVSTMALLDKANTSTYGNPEITSVNIGTRKNPGILISGHDLKDLEILLEQTVGTGVDVYTHGEMLPAHYYPKFKKYPHFVGNYGNAWWLQKKEFESFNGPILMTTNCLVPIKDSYQHRIYTTGVVQYPGVRHISESNGTKDFSILIEQAKMCPPPQEIESGQITGGFAHHQVLQLADKVIAAIKSGAIKKFVVMAGCDGRNPQREYYTELAQTLPKDTVILTAGCAKYRYNKLQLGDIGGIPRVLDAGQCNDSYSLAIIALKLKETLGLKDINELPIAYDIAWYEQKAVTVLLALLYLGVKNIRLGPSLPAFLSPHITQTLVKLFNIQPIETVEKDLQSIMVS